MHSLNIEFMTVQVQNLDQNLSVLTVQLKRRRCVRMKNITYSDQKSSRHISTCGDSHMIQNTENGAGRLCRCSVCYVLTCRF